MHALVTGASRGIGAAIAEQLAQLGYDLTLVARSTGPLEELAARLPTRVRVQPADLSSTAAALELIAPAEAELGPIDLLVNNAGIQYVEPAIGVTAERLERLFAVNLITPIQLMNAVARDMVARGQGVIVNVASMAAVTTTPGMTHYSSTKAGFAAASEGLRMELRGSGVHVVTVYPGPVATDMADAAKANLEMDLASRMVPEGTAKGLAELVSRSIDRRSTRVFYPRSYQSAWMLRPVAQFLVDRFSPPTLDA